jgi:hypothetical protein
MISLTDMSKIQVLELLLIAAITYGASKAVYLLYFSPLAHVPGPKLAALSRWYEWYMDCWNDGRFSFDIRDMHKKYGN